MPRFQNIWRLHGERENHLLVPSALPRASDPDGGLSAPDDDEGGPSVITILNIPDVIQIQIALKFDEQVEMVG